MMKRFLVIVSVALIATTLAFAQSTNQSTNSGTQTTRTRVVAPKHARFDAALDHANLPDPVTDMIRALAEQNEKLRKRLSAVEDKLGVAHDEPPFQLPYDGDELPRADGG